MAERNAAQVLDAKQLRHAKKGIMAGVLSGLTWGASGTLLGIAAGIAPFSDQPADIAGNPSLEIAFIAACALAGAFLHDLFAAIWVNLYNIKNGKFKEYGRTLRTKPGRMVCLGAVIGGPIGMSGYLMGINFVDAAYALPITAAYPAVAAVLATFILRERNSLRVWLGVVLAISGSFIVYYSPPSGVVNPYFTLGMILTTLACVGWSCEGLLSTYGMDMLDPDVALGIREGVSAIVYFIVILPVVSLIFIHNYGVAHIWPLVSQACSNTSFLLFVLAGFFGGFSYLYWYRALNMTGVARAMALNVTYALWGVIFGAMFTPLVPSAYLYSGAAAIAIGSILVSANPRELFNLRSV